MLDTVLPWMPSLRALVHVFLHTLLHIMLLFRAHVLLLYKCLFVCIFACHQKCNVQNRESTFPGSIFFNVLAEAGEYQQAM